MNLRDLSYIVAVAETRHFGRAAERCFVSQPTLSGQVKKLEEELGVTIFERSNRSVDITAVGEDILRHARRLLEQSDAIEQVARAAQDPLAGPLRVGAIPTLSPYLMPQLLAPLRQQYPQLKLILREEVTDALLLRLRRHELDALLLATPAEDADLDQIPLFDEPFWLAHPPGHPLAAKPKITDADLEAADLLLLAEGHCLSQQVMHVCRLAERPHTSAAADLSAASLETLRHLVRAGFGCTLVPALALDSGWRDTPGISVRPLSLPDARRHISLVHRRSFPRTAALQALARVVREVLPDLAPPAGTPASPITAQAAPPLNPPGTPPATSPVTPSATPAAAPRC
ncbi:MULTISPECIES: LysR substrate-binding domain-containing protein [Thiorhodovibrio]|uniref:LysR substrate-binding domain-containing protein n=1 Tax=Thiorhodovibrio TaxID=61593 RepID=UPI001914BD0F|nr:MULTISPECIES: LysR substrate-binding domain-containing protein [Thiorhodovibrio]MBK5968072.1 LysR family transcriptional regulator [Thiorhodovibrio winogradskyi]WPL11889.1 Morphology and auto-aggregation control protein [Thiorhodovibrio litoralis]